MDNQTWANSPIKAVVGNKQMQTRVAGDGGGQANRETRYLFLGCVTAGDNKSLIFTWSSK